eukprot:5824509-Alexandrium_andersonii.AAC.1
MSASLVGSEMCIRDSCSPTWSRGCSVPMHGESLAQPPMSSTSAWLASRAVSYTHLTLPTICSV